MAPPPPPPPPPLPSKLLKSTKAVQMVPEVVEWYRLLVKREGKNDGKPGSTGIPVAANSRDMIGEIENKSAYVIAVSAYIFSIFSLRNAYRYCLSSETTANKSLTVAEYSRLHNSYKFFVGL
jgi:hypothetical protein